MMGLSIVRFLNVFHTYFIRVNTYEIRMKGQSKSYLPWQENEKRRKTVKFSSFSQL